MQRKVKTKSKTNENVHLKLNADAGEMRLLCSDFKSSLQNYRDIIISLSIIISRPSLTTEILVYVLAQCNSITVIYVKIYINYASSSIVPRLSHRRNLILRSFTTWSTYLLLLA